MSTAINIDPADAGRWQTADELADLFSLVPKTVHSYTRRGLTCRGWRFESRPARESDEAGPYTKLMYRAERDDTTRVYVLCDVVGGRLIPETYGTLGECRAYARRPMYSGGPPTKIIQMEDVPEMGVALCRRHHEYL